MKEKKITRHPHMCARAVESFRDEKVVYLLQHLCGAFACDTDLGL